MRPAFSSMMLTVLLATAFVLPAKAQITYDAAHRVYFVTGDATINTDVSGNDVYVGIDNATSFKTLSGPITLTVADGATVTSFGGVAYPVGGNNPYTYIGLYVFGNNRVNITGGSVRIAFSLGNTPADATLSISGGTVNNAYSFNTTSISGGRVNDAKFYADSMTSISGGSIGELYGFDNSVINITGGTFDTNTIRLYKNTVANFFGTGLGIALTGIGSDSLGAYTKYVLSGTLQNGQSIKGVTLRDYGDGGFQVGNGAGSAAVYFNGAAAQVSATAPEPGSVALLMLSGLPFAAAITCRRRN